VASSFSSQIVNKQVFITPRCYTLPHLSNSAQKLPLRVMLSEHSQIRLRVKIKQVLVATFKTSTSSILDPIGLRNILTVCLAILTYSPWRQLVRARDKMLIHLLALIVLNDSCTYWVAKRNGMKNNEQVQVRQWWKPGHSFPQLLLDKHIYFPIFRTFMRTSLPCGPLGSAPVLRLQYTLFGYCTATYSWHLFRGPCLLIPIAYSWPSLCCLLHVRSTPWLTGSSFLRGEGVQRVCSCRHNKWAARLPLTALLQGKGAVEGMSAGAERCLTACGLVGHYKTAA